MQPIFPQDLTQHSSPHQHPLLYLKGVKYSDLQSVLHFMYQGDGEVNVAKEDLKSFLTAAEDLKVKGLSQRSWTRKTIIKSKPEQPPNNKSISPPSPSIPPLYTNTADYDDIQETSPVKSEPIDPLPPITNLSPIISQENQHYTPESQAQTIAPSDDHSLAYQETYEKFEEFRNVDKGIFINEFC